MDFKVTGTEKGITALQMDNKATGLTVDILRPGPASRPSEGPSLHPGQAMLADHRRAARARSARPPPASTPFKIPVDKIREVIGSAAARRSAASRTRRARPSTSRRTAPSTSAAVEGPAGRGRQGHRIQAHRQGARGGRGVRRPRSWASRPSAPSCSLCREQGRPAPHQPRGARAASSKRGGRAQRRATRCKVKVHRGRPEHGQDLARPLGQAGRPRRVRACPQRALRPPAPRRPRQPSGPRQPQQQRKRRRQRRPHPAPPPRRLGTVTEGRASGPPSFGRRSRSRQRPVGRCVPPRRASLRSSSPCARWQAKPGRMPTAGGRETLPPPVPRPAAWLCRRCR